VKEGAGNPNRDWLNRGCFEYDTKLSGTKAWLIFADNTVFVYRRTSDAPYYPDMLDLIGGGANPGETPFDCVSREIHEETGLKVNRDHVIAARQQKSTIHQGTNSWYFVIKLFKETFPDVIWSEEGIDPEAISIETLLKPDLKLAPNIRERTELFRPFLEDIDTHPNYKSPK
jgi:8-oxo-dGTP diphosphatase